MYVGALVLLKNSRKLSRKGSKMNQIGLVPTVLLRLLEKIPTVYVATRVQRKKSFIVCRIGGPQRDDDDDEEEDDEEEDDDDIDGNHKGSNKVRITISMAL